MKADREGKVVGIKQQIERGDYRVDPRAVAEAILRRLDDTWQLSPFDRAEAYNKCSYPECSGLDSPKVTPLAP
jgi:hypothetical protein